jgi:predicted Rdx family selenoprotein
MADDSTQAILATHAAILDRLAAQQDTLGQMVLALTGIVQRQQDDGMRTADTLAQLVTQVKTSAAARVAKWDEELKRRADIKAIIGVGKTTP